MLGTPSFPVLGRRPSRNLLIQSCSCVNIHWDFWIHRRRGLWWDLPLLNADGTGLSPSADRGWNEGDVVAVFHMLIAAAGWVIVLAVMDLAGGIESPFVFIIKCWLSGCESE